MGLAKGCKKTSYNDHFCMCLKYRAKAAVFCLKKLDLISLESFQNTTLLILLIVLMRIYINCNLWAIFGGTSGV